MADERQGAGLATAWLLAAPAAERANLAALADWCAATRGAAAGRRGGAAVATARRELDGDAAGPGRVLRGALATGAVERAWLDAFLAALEREAHVGTFATWGELRGHAEALGAPLIRAALRACGRESAAADLRAGAAAAAGELVFQLAHLGAALDRGQLYLPADLLPRHGCAPADLRARPRPERLGAVLAEHADAVRRELAKGFGLARELGPLRGRAAAAWLRAVHAELRRAAAAGDRVLDAPRPLGGPRLAAAVLRGLAARDRPLALRRLPG